MTIEILPCPFCGYDDVEFDEIAPGTMAICCPECEMIGPNFGTAQDANEAIKAWNRRNASDNR